MAGQKTLTKQHANSRILLIDDDITNNLLMESILYNDGFKQVRSVADSRFVSNVILQFDPELILLDLEMPYYNGFSILNKLKKLNKKGIVPVIVVTAKNDHQNKTRALSYGIQYFIEKPFDKTELITIVQNNLQIYWQYNQAEQKNKNLEKKLDLKKRQITELESSSVEALLLTLKYRDPDAWDHVNRTGDLVYWISRSMGLTEEQSANFGKASRLHDMGKIGVPDSVLHNGGHLTWEEYEIIESHSLIGENILSFSNSLILKLGRVIARTHHENWNGTGYPYGLSATQIPLAARITSVADVFDALTSERPYKEAWEKERALAYIESESGKKFDPDVVNALLYLFRN